MFSFWMNSTQQPERQLNLIGFVIFFKSLFRFVLRKCNKMSTNQNLKTEFFYQKVERKRYCDETIKLKQNWIWETPRAEVKKHHQLYWHILRQNQFYFHIKVSHDLWFLEIIIVHKINMNLDYVYLTLPYRFVKNVSWFYTLLLTSSSSIFVLEVNKVFSSEEDFEEVFLWAKIAFCNKSMTPKIDKPRNRPR